MLRNNLLKAIRNGQKVVIHGVQAHVTPMFLKNIGGVVVLDIKHQNGRKGVLFLDMMDLRRMRLAIKEKPKNNKIVVVNPNGKQFLGLKNKKHL